MKCLIEIFNHDQFGFALFFHRSNLVNKFMAIVSCIASLKLQASEIFGAAVKNPDVVRIVHPSARLNLSQSFSSRFSLALSTLLTLQPDIRLMNSFPGTVMRPLVVAKRHNTRTESAKVRNIRFRKKVITLFGILGACNLCHVVQVVDFDDCIEPVQRDSHETKALSIWFGQALVCYAGRRSEQEVFVLWKYTAEIDAK